MYVLIYSAPGSRGARRGVELARDSASDVILASPGVLMARAEFQEVLVSGQVLETFK